MLTALMQGGVENDGKHADIILERSLTENALTPIKKSLNDMYQEWFAPHKNL